MERQTTTDRQTDRRTDEREVGASVTQVVVDPGSCSCHQADVMRVPHAALSRGRTGGEGKGASRGLEFEQRWRWHAGCRQGLPNRLRRRVTGRISAWHCARCAVRDALCATRCTRRP
eukprot:364790-Chlamydomonas_euryale.AAC.4